MARVERPAEGAGEGGRVLAVTVVVRGVDGQPVVLAAGDAVPEWAEVGEHVLVPVESGDHGE